MNDSIVSEIEELRNRKNAVILCHTYQNGEIQDAADFVGDSLGLSRQAADSSADLIVFCGVRFMAETAAILNPHKKVCMPVPSAGCPMADMADPEELARIKKQYQNVPVVCYVNSPAEIKAMSDVCVTSANAVQIVNDISEQKIIFLPDRNLGLHVRNYTDKEIILWDGYCPVHEKIPAYCLKKAKQEHPEAAVMVHPECVPEVQQMSDHILSTGGMCSHVSESNSMEFIIGTETGIIHTLKKANPDKRFHPVTDAVCADMKKTTLQDVLECLRNETGAVTVPSPIAEKAETAISRMLRMSR